MLYSKELEQSKTQFQQYGWRNVSTVFIKNILPYLIEYMKEVIDQETDRDGNILKSYFGITRLPDIKGWQKGWW